MNGKDEDRSKEANASAVSERKSPDESKDGVVKNVCGGVV